ncbi:tripartite tricarboxylate transporter TctB family protein [Nonomuraea sp. NPDC000554]|uniref:tripartite tricarboxylate transporter TctB family protein n=1 Tax=Nonomuraea sp. NPDC000554 TaxID=3154259 RepID=UPI00332D6323
MTGASPLVRLATAAALLALGAFLLIQSLSIAAGARHFPLVVCSAWTVFAAVNLVQAVKEYRGSPRDKLGSEPFLIIAVLAGYAFTVIPLGFVLATAIAFLLITWILGSRAFVRDAIVAVLLSAGVYLAFTQFLSIRLPAGVFAL